jgi:hypothetical protein
MADEGVVVTAPGDAEEGFVSSLVVSVDGVLLTAVTIEGALYTPTAGADVVTIPLSDGRVLLLGPSS